MEEVEVPRGLVRTWKALLGVGWTCIFSTILGAYLGHTTARVVEKEVRIEVPTPACRDEMIQIEDRDDLKHISCSHPDHHGEFKSVPFDRYNQKGMLVPYLVCTCPHAQLALPEGGSQ